MDEDRTYLTGEDPASPGRIRRRPPKIRHRPGRTRRRLRRRPPRSRSRRRDLPWMRWLRRRDLPSKRRLRGRTPPWGDGHRPGGTALGGEEGTERRRSAGAGAGGLPPGGQPHGHGVHGVRHSLLLWNLLLRSGGISLGSLAILFGLLSRMGQKMETRAAAGIAMGAASMVISLALLISLVVIGMANAS